MKLPKNVSLSDTEEPKAKTPRRRRRDRFAPRQVRFLNSIHDLGQDQAMAELGISPQELDEWRRNSNFEAQYFQAVGLTAKQFHFADIFYEQMGNISMCCRMVGISRQTYYDWMRLNPVFAELIQYKKEALVDFAESKLLSNINEGKESSIFYYLDHQGRERGYGRKFDIPASATQVNIQMNTDRMSMEEIDAEIKRLEQKEEEQDAVE